VALILVVDDNPGVRAVIRRALTEVGHEVALAVDGASGLQTYYELATQLAPDLAIVDRFMPEMDGIQLMRQFHTVAPTMPVLLMSGDPSWPLGDAMAGLGPNDVLAKPFHPDALVSAVASALARAAPPDRRQDSGAC
jgi:CheY-like chemotaxis protein